MRIYIVEQKINNIPVLEVYHPEELKPPVILILHGLTGDKETGLKNAYKLARLGFFAVLFDTARDGELSDADFLKLNYFQKTLETTAIILESVKYVNQLIDHYSSFQAVDGQRIGLIGFSMGGCTIYQYLSGTIHPQVKAAVSVVGSPMGGKALRKLFQKSPESMPYLDEAKLQYAESVIPFEKLTSLKDFPLLMLNGSLDSIFDITDIRNCFETMQVNYTDPSKIQKIEYEAVGHTVTDEMIHQTGPWFNRFLHSSSDSKLG